MISVFSEYLGKCTSLQAEAKTLLIRMKLCVQRGFIENLVVESDSLMLIRILLKIYQCPWSISREVENIVQVARVGFQFTSCYREANKVADVLSNEGYAYPDQLVCVYESIADLPTMARGEYRLDKFAFPFFHRFRITCNIS